MSPGRLSAAKLSALIATLSDRDRSIIGDLARTRVLTGSQLTRLHFAELSPSSHHRNRRRVLERLTALGLTTALDRRIGGVRAGSSGLVYALGIAGQRALPLLELEAHADPAARARRPWTPGLLFLAHSLDVSELYVQLREQERTGVLTLVDYTTEPASWFPAGLGGTMKPDAYMLLRAGEVEESTWMEIDRATESLPTLRRKLLAYVDFALSGQLGPDHVVPRVVVTVPHERRLEAVSKLIAELPDPADRLIHVVLHAEAVTHATRTLHR